MISESCTDLAYKNWTRIRNCQWKIRQQESLFWESFQISLPLMTPSLFLVSKHTVVLQCVNDIQTCLLQHNTNGHKCSTRPSVLKPEWQWEQFSPLPRVKEVVGCGVSCSTPYIDTVCVISVLGNTFVLEIHWFATSGPPEGCYKKICSINVAAAALVFLVCFSFWAENIRNNYNWPFSTSFGVAPIHLLS